MTLPFEQLTIFIVVAKETVAGEFPIAVTTKEKVRMSSTFDLKLTYSLLYMLASIPLIVYASNPQSGLLKVNGVIA